MSCSAGSLRIAVVGDAGGYCELMGTRPSGAGTVTIVDVAVVVLVETCVAVLVEIVVVVWVVKSVDVVLNVSVSLVMMVIVVVSNSVVEVVTSAGVMVVDITTVSVSVTVVRAVHIVPAGTPSPLLLLEEWLELLDTVLDADEVVAIAE